LINKCDFWRNIYQKLHENALPENEDYIKHLDGVFDIVELKLDDENIRFILGKSFNQINMSDRQRFRKLSVVSYNKYKGFYKNTFINLSKKEYIPTVIELIDDTVFNTLL